MSIKKASQDIRDRFTTITNFFANDDYFDHDDPSSSGLWKFLSSKTGLQPRHFYLYYIICKNFFENNYQPVHLYQACLARLSGFNVRTVRNATRKWIKADLPIIEVSYPPKHQLSNGVWINDANLYSPTLYYNTDTRKLVDLQNIASSYKQALLIDTHPDVPSPTGAHKSPDDNWTSATTYADIDGIF